MWTKGDAVGQRNLKEGEYVDYPILTLIDSKEHPKFLSFYTL